MTKSLALALVLAAACGASPMTSDTLDETVRLYHEDLVWEKFAVAANHLPAKERAAAVDEWDQRAHDLKITQADIVKVDPHGDREAKVQVKLSWYKESEGTVHETQAVQTWEKHGKSWFMVDEARLRGAEMPGLPEPMMKDPLDKDDKDAKDAPKSKDAAPDKTAGQHAETDAPARQGE